MSEDKTIIVKISQTRKTIRKSWMPFTKSDRNKSSKKWDCCSSDSEIEFKFDSYHPMMMTVPAKMMCNVFCIWNYFIRISKKVSALKEQKIFQKSITVVFIITKKEVIYLHFSWIVICNLYIQFSVIRSYISVKNVSVNKLCFGSYQPFSSSSVFPTSKEFWIVNLSKECYQGNFL